jgi:Flp pilus assembly protein CpaB
MTHRLRNVVVAIGLAVVAMTITLMYVTNYRKSVQQSEAQVQVYVASHDIPAGTAGADLVSGHAFRVTQARKTAVVQGAITDPDQIKTLILATPLFADEQVTLRHFTDVAAQGIRAHLKRTMRAVEVPGDANQLLSGTLQVGDHVDLVANLHPNAVTGGDVNATRIVLRDLSVLVAPGQPAVTPVSGNQQSVILAVTEQQAVRLFFVMKNGDWTLELRPVINAKNGPNSVETVTTLLNGGIR